MISKKEAHPFFHQTLVEIKQADILESPEDWQQEAYPIKSHTLIYVVKGKGELQLNHRPSQFSPKTAFMLLPGTVVKWKVEPDRPLLLFRLAFHLFRMGDRSSKQLTFDKELEFPVTGKLAIAHTAAMSRLCKQLAACDYAAPSVDPLRYQQHMHKLFALLVGSVPAYAEHADDPIQRTLHYMERQYATGVTLQELAQVAQMHPTYYSAQFKLRLGKSPIEYLNQLRMNRARELMLTTPEKMRNIARLTGFSDEFYFSRRFKASYGSSPTVYMKKHPPLKVSSLSSPYTENLLVLGINPCEKDSNGELLSEKKWLSAKTDGMASWEYKRRSLLSSKPDVILCKEHILNETRMYMGDIAPIITVPWLSLDCFDHMRAIAKLTDRESHAQHWMEQHEAREAQALKQVEQKIGRSSAAICVIAGHKIKMYGGRNIGHVFYRSLRLEPPEQIRREMNKHDAGTIFNWLEVPAEQFGQYEADYLFVLIEPKAGALNKLAELQATEGWQRHRAVRKNNVFMLDWSRWIGYSPFSITKQLDDAVALLTAPRYG
ncbi:hypothetical protein BBD42_19185 [Paenibacillus sp. BIHB 4019]|uniref:AraC family transcriptional regulator n=1 Tax=Paenibacillus sp. BIHB 4019 TaxID=1870819 RepID=A0A1B2DKW6_9BACL|nr:AraC family transcriptional regulator [Paenibacillus sp. BIHB 4019]ANY68360.1 hypothetical protein BBD42_19185 [Paenibacillus sp. BIHB 4019]